MMAFISRSYLIISCPQIRTCTSDEDAISVVLRQPSGDNPHQTRLLSDALTRKPAHGPESAGQVQAILFGTSCPPSLLISFQCTLWIKILIYRLKIMLKLQATLISAKFKDNSLNLYRPIALFQTLKDADREGGGHQ